jgi:PTH1 family peptidyl-tRNA hydrolase
MKLIVGLGNPGKAYAGNRHNVGFRCIDRLSAEHRIPVKERRLRLKPLKAVFGRGEVGGAPVVLAKPRTFMNLSGRAVAQLVRRFGVAPDDLIVTHDDMDLPLGKIRIRRGGSAGGHKGVASIIDSLGSEGFTRVRIGIGRPGGDEVSHVLGDFTAEEKATVTQAVDQAAEAARCILSDGIEAAMNRYN